MKLLMAEILHRLIGSLSHYLEGFIHPGWCKISAINRRTKGFFFQATGLLVGWGFQLGVKLGFIPMTDPWDERYIYLHEDPIKINHSEFM